MASYDVIHGPEMAGATSINADPEGATDSQDGRLLPGNQADNDEGKVEGNDILREGNILTPTYKLFNPFMFVPPKTA